MERTIIITDKQEWQEENQQQEKQNTTETVQPDKAAYIQRIYALSAEEQAFMDGYLFAKVTERRKAI